MATVLVCWIVGSFLLAPIVGRALRGRPEPRPERHAGRRVAA